MKKILGFIRDEDKRTILFLVLSGISLAASFFLKNVVLDPVWVAALLCGIPILIDAGTGLFTRFDIKADVLVSLALIASIVTGEVFAAGEVAFIMAIGAMLEERTIKRPERALKNWYASPRARRA